MIYLKFAYHVMVKLSEDAESANRVPLIAPCFCKAQNQIFCPDAKIILNDVLLQMGVEYEVAQKVVKNFDNIVYSDCYQRLLDQKLYKQKDGFEVLGYKWKFDANPENHSIIRFDYLCNFVLEYFFEKLHDQMDKLYTSLRLYNTRKCEEQLTYSNFESAIDTIGYDRIYTL